jgi:broad specificity phosphatase PhoE
MLHAMHGTSWPEAFVKAIPQRKLNPDQSSRVKRRQRRAEAAAKELKTDVIEEHKSVGTSSDSSSSVSD